MVVCDEVSYHSQDGIVVFDDSKSHRAFNFSSERYHIYCSALYTYLFIDAYTIHKINTYNTHTYIHTYITYILYIHTYIHIYECALS